MRVAFLVSTWSAALAQYTVPSPKAVAEGAKQRVMDAANAEVEGAKDGAAAKAAPATEKANQAKAAADSAKRTGDAVKALGTFGK